MLCGQSDHPKAAFLACSRDRHFPSFSGCLREEGILLQFLVTLCPNPLNVNQDVFTAGNGIPVWEWFMQ